MSGPAAVSQFSCIWDIFVASGHKESLLPSGVHHAAVDGAFSCSQL